MKSKLHTFAASSLVLGMVSAMGGSAMAQAKQPVDGGAPTKADPGKDQGQGSTGDPRGVTGDPAATLKELQRVTGVVRDAEKDIVKLLKEKLTTVKRAAEIFDRMMKSVETAAAIGKPGSAFMNELGKLIAEARLDAERAENDGFPKLAARFKKRAAELEAVRRDAEKLYIDSFREIREIRDRKRYVIYLIKLKAYSEAAKNARAFTKKIATLQTTLQKFNRQIPREGGQSQ